MDTADLCRNAFALHDVCAAELRIHSSNHHVRAGQIGFRKICRLFPLLRHVHAGDHRVHLSVLQGRQQIVEFQVHELHLAVTGFPGHALYQLHIKADKSLGGFLIIFKRRIIRVGAHAQYLFRMGFFMDRRSRLLRRVSAAARNGKQANDC